MSKTSKFKIRNHLRSNGFPFKGILILWILGIGLTLFGIGDLPIRDFDEGTVARVSFELSQKQGLDKLLPTLWGEPYINKPPGLHWLISEIIKINHIFHPASKELPSEFVIRLVPAFLSALIIPLGGILQWQLRPNEKITCLLTSSILLTLLPIIRHGRLAMLDGTQLSTIAVLWSLLLSINQRSDNSLKALGAGLTMSAMLLLKAPLLIPAIIAGIIPLIWNQEFKKLRSLPIILWSLIGLLPGIIWHIFHGLQRGIDALWLWGGDGAGRVLFNAGEGSDMGWKVPILELLEGGWPWLLLWPCSMAIAWQQRGSRWGKWAISTQIILAGSILPLKTQLPWYSHPLWLPFALLCAVPMSWLITKNNHDRLAFSEILSQVPSIWMGIGIVVLSFGLIAASPLATNLRLYSKIAIAAGLGWSIGGWLMQAPTKRKRVQGIACLFSGSFFSLLLLMGSPLWLWELNENWAVHPVAQLAEQVRNSNVLLEGNDERPSLNWYAGQRIRRFDSFSGNQWILTKNPKQVREGFKNKFTYCLTSKSSNEWKLLFCQKEKSESATNNEVTK